MTTTQGEAGANMKMDYRHWTAMAVVIVGSVILVIGAIQGAIVPAAIFVAVQCCVVGVWFWLTRPGRSVGHISHVSAQAAAGEGDVILYWQPG